jgi:hypothetical protein
MMVLLGQHLEVWLFLELKAGGTGLQTAALGFGGSSTYNMQQKNIMDLLGHQEEI